MVIYLSELAPQAIAEVLGIKPFQGKQIFEWLHKKRVFRFEEMTNLSKALRGRLEEQACALRVEAREDRLSKVSGTRKVVLALRDGALVEAVLIRDGERVTLCLSSQVGCPLKCAFCATGQSGFERDLSAGEIVEQALFLLAEVDLGLRTPNIVYMGMGEPFLNYEAMRRSVDLLMHPAGLGIGARKITVSTVGIVPGIERFAEEGWQVRLSVSLHAANNALRDRLMPVNRRYPLEALHAAVRRYQALSGRQMTFEWTLLDGVNDSREDLRELVNFVGGLKASVNLIPWNPVAGTGFHPSCVEKVEAFRDGLEAAGIAATVRQEKGGDIDAACGQLRGRRISPGKPLSKD